MCNYGVINVQMCNYGVIKVLMTKVSLYISSVYTLELNFHEQRFFLFGIG